MEKINRIVQQYAVIEAIIISIIFTYIISLGSNSKYALIIQSSALLGAFLFVLLALLAYKVLITFDLLKEWPVIFPALIFSISIVLGLYFFEEKDNLLNVVLLMIALTGIIFLMLVQCYRYLAKIKNQSHFLFKPKYFWLLWLFIFVTWLPAFLAMYPGNLSYDGVPQLLQTIGHQGLSAHHPVLHTLYLTYSVELGKNIFGSYNIGLAIYSLTQMALLSSSLAYMVHQLIKRRVNKFFVICAILFVSINPLIQIWALTTTKDIPFAALFIFSFILLFDLVKEPKVFLRSKKEMLKFSAVLILLCLLRNQGVYVLLFTSLFVFWAIKGKENKLRFSVSMVGILVIIKLILGPLSTIAGVSPGDSREMYSVPMQQIARVYSLRKDAISRDQLKIIEKVIPEGYLVQYNPLVSDPVKSGFDTKNFDKNKSAFIKVWADLGLHNKRLYLESFLYGSVGYFYPDTIPYWLWYIMYDGAHPEFSPIKIERKPLLKTYDHYLRNFSEKLSFQKIPVYSLVVNEAFPFLAIIFSLGYAFYQRQYKKVALLMLPFGFWGTLLLGPVIAVRYAFPIYVCIPFILGLVFIDENQKEKI